MAIEFDVMYFDAAAKMVSTTKIRMERDMVVSVPGMDWEQDDLMLFMTGQKSAERTALERIGAVPLTYLMRHTSLTDLQVMHWGIDCVYHVLDHFKNSGFKQLDTYIALLRRIIGKSFIRAKRTAPLAHGSHASYSAVLSENREELREGLAEIIDNCYEWFADSFETLDSQVFMTTAAVLLFKAAPWEARDIRIDRVTGEYKMANSSGLARLFMLTPETLMALNDEGVSEDWSNKQLKPYGECVDRENGMSEFKDRWIGTEMLWAYNRAFDYIEGYVKL
jgi:hypothetical protein